MINNTTTTVQYGRIITSPEANKKGKLLLSPDSRRFTQQHQRMYRPSKRGGYSPRRRKKAYPEAKNSYEGAKAEETFYTDYLASLKNKRESIKKKRLYISQQKDELYRSKRLESSIAKGYHEVKDIDADVDAVPLQPERQRPKYISPKKVTRVLELSTTKLNNGSRRALDEKDLRREEVIHRPVEGERSDHTTLTIASLQSQLRKEREISSLMRTSLMEVQSQKQELEEKMYISSQEAEKMRSRLMSDIRMAEGKYSGFETYVKENEDLKLQISNQKVLIESLHAQLRKHAKSKGIYDTQAKISSLSNERAIEVLEIENRKLKEEIEDARREKIAAQNQAKEDRKDLLDSYDVIVSLREAVQNARVLQDNFT